MMSFIRSDSRALVQNAIDARAPEPRRVLVDVGSPDARWRSCTVAGDLPDGADSRPRHRSTPRLSDSVRPGVNNQMGDDRDRTRGGDGERTPRTRGTRRDEGDGRPDARKRRRPAGTVTVSAGTTVAPTATPEDGQPVLGFVVGLGVLVVLARAIRRWE